MLTRSIITLSVATLALAGCMGNTAGTGNALVQAAAAQALAQGAVTSSDAGTAAALVAGSGAISGNSVNLAGLTPSANAFVSGYQSYSCNELNTLIGTLQPSQASAGLAGLAGMASIFGGGRASQAAAVLNSQATVSATQASQLEAAQAVAASKGC